MDDEYDELSEMSMQQIKKMHTQSNGELLVTERTEDNQSEAG